MIWTLPWSHTVKLYLPGRSYCLCIIQYSLLQVTVWVVHQVVTKFILLHQGEIFTSGIIPQLLYLIISWCQILYSAVMQLLMFPTLQSSKASESLAFSSSASRLGMYYIEYVTLVSNYSYCLTGTFWLHVYNSYQNISQFHSYSSISFHLYVLLQSTHDDVLQSKASALCSVGDLLGGMIWDVPYNAMATVTKACILNATLNVFSIKVDCWVPAE